MTKVVLKIKAWFENFDRGKKRKLERDLRLTIIRENKKQIATDIAVGHNVNDYTLDQVDILEVMKSMQGHAIPLERLLSIKKKYRG
jgi:hypothetical protein